MHRHTLLQFALKGISRLLERLEFDQRVLELVLEFEMLLGLFIQLRFELLRRLLGLRNTILLLP